MQNYLYELSEIRKMTGILLSEEPVTVVLNKFSQTASGRSFVPLTVCAFALSIGGAILYLLYMEAKVYNFDGSKRYHYMGSVIFHTVSLRSVPYHDSEEFCRLRLSRSMAYMAVTGIYQIRPGKLFLRRYYGKRLLVENPLNGSKVSLMIKEKIICRFE